MDCSSSPVTEGMIDVDHASREAVVLLLWDHMKCAVNACPNKIKLVLSIFGVTKDLSVFSKKFEVSSDLTLVYKVFYPSTFICP